MDTPSEDPVQRLLAQVAVEQGCDPQALRLQNTCPTVINVVRGSVIVARIDTDTQEILEP